MRDIKQVSVASDRTSLLNVTSESLKEDVGCGVRKLTPNITSLSNFADENSSPCVFSPGQPLKSVPSFLSKFLPWSDKDRESSVDIELQEICTTGRELQRLADGYAHVRPQPDSCLTPAFRINGKLGWFSAAALLTTGIGAFAYSRELFGTGNQDSPLTDPTHTHSTSAMRGVTSLPEPLPIAAPIWVPRESTTTSEMPDDVKIVMKDFSCIKERETLTAVDIFRKIGSTLLSPVEELARESQVINYLNNIGHCPNEEEMKFLSEITSKVDQVINAVISLIPGAMSVVIIKRVGGNLFKMFADNMEGKPVDFYNAYALNDQVLMMAKMIADFSPKDENGQLINDKLALPEDTYLEDGDMTTWIDTAKYIIINKKGDFIARGNDGEFPTRYSNQKKSWYLVRDKNDLAYLPLSPLQDANPIIIPYPAIADFEIADALKDVRPLDANLFSASRPNDKGIYRCPKEQNRSAMQAVKLNGMFYRVSAGTTKKRMAIYEKTESEIIMYDGTWYLATKDKRAEVKSVPCRVKRSPYSLCMSYSQDLNEVLTANRDYASSPLTFSWLRSDKDNPAILVSENNKKYIQHNGAVFKIKVVSPINSDVMGSSEIRIFGKKRTGLFKRKNDFYITSAYFSELKGNGYLYSKIENVMETLYLPRSIAEAYQSVKDFERAKGQITSEEYASIRAYGGVSYRDINDFIYNGRLNDYTDSERKATVISHIKNIRTLLKKLPSIDGVVYRGSQLTTLGAKAFSELKAEDIISSRKFISASMDRAVANIFAAGPNAIRYTIHVKKSAHPILTFTGKLREAEVIIEDNVLFRCVYVYGRDVVLEEIVNPSTHDMRRLKNVYI
ncbi:ADP-ribosyltransferase [Erwinia piriflorinigrans]|uniref:NAD(+)--protein-arginine ADP-ribosyltransferase n=1 Tax=Erwinia piriflorinigrans CFBP 5888 TaxID=1161919 RepID=V5Z9B3_9GAMM|nr:ADP-ribosyltransferase [Erwinia piriflorinigrans]CCG87834.1 hypothetical protein EPIR_2471 [Erwinia piriflorinigrans CFBP 5888]